MADLRPRRSALFLPASNPRAVEKARGLAADLILLDLEDAVRPEDKDAARAAAVDAVARGYDHRETAIRINPPGSTWHERDLAAVAGARADYLVLPKGESPELVSRIAVAGRRPVLVMIETPAGVLAAPAIAQATGVAGLIAGTNDLAATLRLPADAGRGPMTCALQAIVLAARAAGILAFDGVFNRLDDPAGLEAECREGRRLGFDGKTLIHPGQIEIANRAFSPSEAELEEARALIAAATGGAERFRGRMIETLHVEAARRVLASVARDEPSVGAAR
jgi:citrate lyase subunit beta/citryl-CoA lyase